MSLKNLSFLDKATLVLAVGLLLCLLPLPYGFYTVVRLAVAVIAGCWAYQFYKSGKMPLAIIAGAVAILFQPLIKIVLDITTWNLLDVLLAIALVILIISKNRQTLKDSQYKED